MLSRSDQLRFTYIDVLNQALARDGQFKHLVIPRYTEGKSQDLPTALALNCLTFVDETPFIGDRVGTIYSNFTLYAGERQLNTSIVDFRVLPSIVEATHAELTDALFQIDFLEKPVVDPVDHTVGTANTVVSRLDYVTVSLTDSALTQYSVRDKGIVPNTLLIYQESCVFTRGVHWDFDTETGVITFLPVPSDGSERITPRINPEVTIVYLTKRDQRTVQVRLGEFSDDLIPHVRITIGHVTAGDVYNIRRTREKLRSYDVYQGMSNYTLTLTGAAQTKADAEKLMNHLLATLRALRPRVAHYGMDMREIQGSLNTDQEEIDVSGDMSKGFEITWSCRCQYEYQWPVPVQLFEVMNFVFDSELSGTYQAQPQPLEFLTFMEKFQ